jgi:2'-5' RNA ligase
MDANNQPPARLFVALALSDEVRQALADFETQARRIRVRVGWVKPENLHVTLAFLGLVPAEDQAVLIDRLEKAARLFTPFDFEAAGIGWFGGRRPRVIWAGVPPEPGSEAIVRVAGAVRAAVREAGHPDDEREVFVPHITVGRLRPGSDPVELMAFIQKRHQETAFGLTRATGFRLMRSDLGPEGTAYSIQHDCPFVTDDAS